MQVPHVTRVLALVGWLWVWDAEAGNDVTVNHFHHVTRRDFDAVEVPRDVK